MTSSHHGPYDQGYTRATMAYTKRSDLAKVKLPTSFATHSHGVTGGVYKARERIHRSILIYDY